jgi:hypothetical protein
MLNPGDPNAGVYFLDTGYEGLHFDELQDQLYVLDGNSVKKWDAGASAMTWRFRSKQFREPRPVNFGVLEVQADTYPVTVRIDALNLPSATVTKLVARRPAVFSAPTPNTFRYTVSVAGSDSVALPGGFMASDWQIELEGSGAVQAVAMASSSQELMQT